MGFGIILRNGLIIAGILGAVFASQKLLNKSNSQEYVYSKSDKKTQGSSQSNKGGKTEDLYNKIQGSISGGVEAVTDTVGRVGEGIENQKNNVIENSKDAGKRALAKKILDVLGVTPEELAQCNAN